MMSIRVEEDLKRSFMAAVASQGKTATGQITKYMVDYIEAVKKKEGRS